MRSPSLLHPENMPSDHDFPLIEALEQYPLPELVGLVFPWFEGLQPEEELLAPAWLSRRVDRSRLVCCFLIVDCVSCVLAIVSCKLLRDSY